MVQIQIFKDNSYTHPPLKSNYHKRLLLKWFLDAGRLGRDRNTALQPGISLCQSGAMERSGKDGPSRGGELIDKRPFPPTCPRGGRQEAAP